MWWRDAVIYQIYLRSFADANGDGVGDLPGLIGRLDHLSWLGVDAVWLTPVGPSPNTDWGYDVSDYYGIHPDFGTDEDFDRLVAAARERGTRVILDLVPNHTSDRHPWFTEARSSREAAYRDRYVWRDPAPDGGPPNNWTSNFLGPAWTLDEDTGQYYLHHFLPSQPDLNWWSEDVRAEFDRIQRHWYDRGVAGFRIDVVHQIVKDRELRDNPPASPEDHLDVQLLGQRQVFNANRPELHDEVLPRWRQIADGYDPPRLLLGETYFFDVPKLRDFYGEDDELHLAFNFSFLFAPFEAKALRAVVEEIEDILPDFAWPVWAGSNHDVARFPTRWGSGMEDRTRCALLMLCTLRGTCVLYYGDEIGMPDTPVPREELLDPVGIKFHPAHPGRDHSRTPMPWTAEAGAGFTTPDADPWLRIGDAAACNVAAQREDPASTLHLCRDLIGLRRERDDLRSGDYTTLAAPEGAWAYRRGERTVIVLNLQDAATRVDGVTGRILVGTRRERDGEAVSSGADVGPWEAFVLDVG